MLRNLLPTPRTFSQIEEKDRQLQVKNDSWRYVPETSKTAAYALDVDVCAAKDQEEQVDKIKMIKRIPQQEPNVRYVDTQKLQSMDTPLSGVNRGVYIPGDLIQPTRRRSMLSSQSGMIDDGTVANCSVVNTLPGAMDLFIQKNMSIQHSVVLLYFPDQCMNS